MVLSDIPLFPLGTVLFPQMILPLHIFEPRYRQMITECIESNTPFGVVLIQEGQEVAEDPDTGERLHGAPSLYRVGTLAKITDAVKLEGGRYFVTTVGTERFRLLDYRNIKPYMTGDVEIWSDELAPDDAIGLEGLTGKVRDLFRQYVELIMVLANKEIEGLEIPDDPVVLSYLIPHWLNVDMEEKQRLLEISNPAQRLREEDVLLVRVVEYLENHRDRVIREGETGANDDINGMSGYDIAARFSKN